MIIDFHTHAFPDFLAAKAVKQLRDKLNRPVTPVSDGTVGGIIDNMQKWGIDKSVLAPIVTKPSQIRTLNEWAASTKSDKIIPFGSIFPNDGNYKEEIDFVVSLGLKGIKLHAEYQEFFVDSPQMIKLYDYAFSKDLIILQHAGADWGMPEPFHSNPKRFANVVKELKGGVMIAAHLGSMQQFDEVYEELAGLDIYFDVSMALPFVPRELLLKIIKKHGADKILFGSDSPWGNAKDDIEYIKSLPIGKGAQEKILFQNACRILKVKFPLSGGVDAKRTGWFTINEKRLTNNEKLR